MTITPAIRDKFFRIHRVVIYGSMIEGEAVEPKNKRTERIHMMSKIICTEYDKKCDDIAMKYLTYALFLLAVGFAAYSLRTLYKCFISKNMQVFLNLNLLEKMNFKLEVQDEDCLKLGCFLDEGIVKEFRKSL
ncbi:uncharacterized protein LOC131655431 [Vicia villosa]|uniref:uncharacterized protein LOC131655431 n=1 Tax=Vicia villosa TaxID=3911 RepID=UPI00273ACAE2|nr:uncharacterized protein LOC131655431 [Vicia villosa]